LDGCRGLIHLPLDSRGVRVDEDHKPKDYVVFASVIIAGIFGVWLLIVLLSAAGLNITGVEWNFERTGQLGDSFGFLSAMMATFAATFAYNALAHERTESARLRIRESNRDDAEKVETRRLRDREETRDSAERKREDEGTFFRLITLRNSIVADLTTRGTNIVSGTDALERMYNSLSRVIDSDDPDAEYARIYSHYKNDLGHYFRFTYHLVKFAVDRFDGFEQQYEYIRLLRAQLSNAEQGLIALNCVFGGGKGQFKDWVEEFSLLHNLDEHDRIKLTLDSRFDPSAFGTN
jgi:hypothetical protein